MNAFVYKKLKVIVAIFSVITLMACGKKSTPPVTAGSEDTPIPTYNLAWQTVGAEIADQASLISLKVFNGTPYIAYKGFLDSKAHVKKYDGSSWVEVLSGTPATSDDVLFVKMDIDSLGNIFIAYTDPNASNALRVRKFNGTSWSNIITADPTAKLFAIDLYNDQPCITYIDSSDRIAAMLYDGTTWSSHTTSYKAENYISIHVDELASPAATAYIAFR
ncbi:MAG: hypothetical protein WCQ47_08900, partial [bacterium]